LDKVPRGKKRKREDGTPEGPPVAGPSRLASGVTTREADLRGEVSELRREMQEMKEKLLAEVRFLRLEMQTLVADVRQVMSVEHGDEEDGEGEEDNGGGGEDGEGEQGDGGGEEEDEEDYASDD